MGAGGDGGHKHAAPKAAPSMTASPAVSASPASKSPAPQSERQEGKAKVSSIYTAQGLAEFME